MEAQMKAICEGRSTRNDVIQQNLDQYRAVFNRTTQQINVLKAVSCKPPKSIVRCGDPDINSYFRPSGNMSLEQIKAERLNAWHTQAIPRPFIAIRLESLVHSNVHCGVVGEEEALPARGKSPAPQHAPRVRCGTHSATHRDNPRRPEGSGIQ